MRTLITLTICATSLMTSGGYMARSFNSEPVAANVKATGQPCNWYSCQRKPRHIKPAEKSALTMRISALTQERIK